MFVSPTYSKGENISSKALYELKGNLIDDMNFLNSFKNKEKGVVYVANILCPMSGFSNEVNYLYDISFQKEALMYICYSLLAWIYCSLYCYSILSLKIQSISSEY